MDKGKKKAKFEHNWYDLWTKQSKDFFDSADKNLKDLFGKSTTVNPEDHLEKIQQWLDTLKNQWRFIELNQQQKAFENYWKTMSKMCNEASDMMLQEWIKRSRGQQPIKNVHELYELWLNCCHDIYDKSTHAKSYQDTYGEFVNAAMKFWQSTMPK